MKGVVLFTLLACLSSVVSAQNIVSKLYLKTPGNPASEHALHWQKITANRWHLRADSKQNIDIVVEQNNDDLAFKIIAQSDVSFNLQNFFVTDFEFNNSELLLPGLWYKKNDRSSAGSPSILEADSWSFREDRLSTPLAGVYNPTSQQAITVLRKDDITQESLAVPVYGEILLAGYSDLGSLGFGNQHNRVYLQFGYPYQESPKTYLRKLTLAPQSMAFVSLKKGDIVELSYQIRHTQQADFSAFVQHTWQYSIDTLKPQPLKEVMSTAEVKSQLSKFYQQSYLNEKELAGFSGVHLSTAEVEKNNVFEIGFIGRVLLNAFNALQYGNEIKDASFVDMGERVFATYLEHGFNPQGFFRELTDYEHPNPDLDKTLSIRRQSEGVYAALLYMDYHRSQGRDMSPWDSKIQSLLAKLTSLQTETGAFPRKFSPQGKIIDGSGGSSASAVIAYVMAYKYFSNPAYLNIARTTSHYLSSEIVEPGEYFSSTLDANCVDKEAAFYTAMAFYYLAQVTTAEEQSQYIKLAQTANYFVMSWYYTWDVPFAKGQMLGDVGFKTRGWGNVSVENNHVDVFIFGYLDVLRWLADHNGDRRLSDFAAVIESSMKSQLLPRKGHMFNIGKEGYYPEVVQHTNWDYGHFGKGFYNDIFAPGWVVASLWEMLTPGRAEAFLTTNNKSE